MNKLNKGDTEINLLVLWTKIEVILCYHGCYVWMEFDWSECLGQSGIWTSLGAELWTPTLWKGSILWNFSNLGLFSMGFIHVHLFSTVFKQFFNVFNCFQPFCIGPNICNRREIQRIQFSMRFFNPLLDLGDLKKPGIREWYCKPRMPENS